MALISKDKRDWASTIKYAKWFCVLPMIPKVKWDPYPKTRSKDDYIVVILTNAEFKRIYYKYNYIPDKDGLIYAITKNMSLDEVNKLIKKSNVRRYHEEDSPKELILINQNNVKNFIK